MSRQTIIISGASRGLGAATARLAAELGANVVLTARSQADLEQVAQNIEEAGGNALVVAGDVGKLEDCQRVVEGAVGRFGRIDALVNNAGVLEPIASIAEADAAAWHKNLVVNVLGPMMLTQAALPQLRRSEGRVINISSGAAIKAIEGWSAYCAAKGALNQLNAVLAAEETSITAVAFRPGVVDTAMQKLIRQDGREGMPEETHARFRRYYEEGELLPPELPGGALAIVALYAPHAWSGEFLSWDAEKVQALRAQFGAR